MSARRRAPVAGIRPILHAASGDVVGYVITGVAAGPRAIAVGERRSVGDAFHRLAQLPSLPHMRGELVLVFEEALGDRASGLTAETLYADAVDGSIYIAFRADRVGDASTLMLVRREAYWSVLRLCSRLGMIAGRGVRPARDDASARYIDERIPDGAPTRHLAARPIESTVIDAAAWAEARARRGVLPPRSVRAAIC